VVDFLKNPKRERRGKIWHIHARIVVLWQKNRAICAIPAEINKNAVFAGHPRLRPRICARINWRP
jgi:hypothetical protein